MVPHGFNGAEVIDRAYRRYNLALGAGLSQMAGKLFRIGYLGDLNELMLLGAISGAEMAMNDIGIEVELGSGKGSPPNRRSAGQGAFRASSASRVLRSGRPARVSRRE
jgi:alanine-glyoxylate transaminase / serine-glyoxylate transaminase / serine-pyruvate transaminase